MSPRDAASRRRGIIEWASTSGEANVEVLAQHFGVTPSTIRRDLARLTETGQIARTYGGAIPLAAAHQELSLRQRLGEAAAAKRAMAKWARRQVAPGDTVFLDGGSSVAALAHELRDATSLTAVTVSLTSMHELGDVPGINVDCLGGRLRPISQAFVGPITEAALDRLTFDVAFLGTDGVSADRGLCEADLTQTRLKEQVAARTGRLFVLAHAAKVGATPFHAWARIPTPWTLVTDDSLTEEQAAPFADSAIELVMVAVPDHPVR
ncbi:DeoR/GlpR family DNA-binding transcription regulator [Propionicicella superfundia]|uniref:DeoR/GlpR family DNA-binding transcription regulator n=1 Tax=Propionicicella superfundia TaxID=348582 RepID=UPI000415CC95|nr:DeoR/GlpR family DNA-binding transcription regulator [Propionicicella superfundia]